MGDNDILCLRELYEAFSQKLTLVEEKLKDKVSETADDTIFHYTDVDALKSVLENETLWFSNAGYLNDASELQYIIDIIYGVAENISMSVQNGDIKAFFKELIDLLIARIKAKLKEIYIMSFSNNNDSLAYGVIIQNSMAITLVLINNRLLIRLSITQ